MMEATIAGSVANVLTLRMPIAQLYAVEVKGTTDPLTDTQSDPAGQTASDDGASASSADPSVPGAVIPAIDKSSSSASRAGAPTPQPVKKRKSKVAAKPKPKAKIWAVATKQIDEPIYREVDAMNALLATAHISTPATLTNFYDLFQKEPDGYDYTVLQGPEPLRLWSNPRTLVLAQVSDLPNLRIHSTDQHNYTSLAVWSETPPVQQVLLFENDDSQKKFESALADGSIGLSKVSGAGAGDWYQFVSCGSQGDRDKTAAENLKVRDQPGPGEVWLGLENDHDPGVIGFPAGLPKLATAATYACCRQIPGSVNPCKRVRSAHRKRSTATKPLHRSSFTARRA